jgi:peptidoglycan/LPS O-acetylase OafA/YrhL
METKIINYKDISTYRSELMGWSILWIMMLHFTFNQIKPLGFVSQYGFAGVDIFLFVSGFGLFYSLDKDDNLVRFYRKRLLRIFPTYYIIGFITNLLLTHDDILTYLFRYSTIGFWIGREYAEWFIPSIILLYFLAPFIKKLIDKKWFAFICVIIACLYISAYYFTDKEEILDRSHFFILYRIPAFVFGMICAYWLKNNMSSHYFLYILILGIPFFIYFFPYHHQIYNFKYYSLGFLLPLFLTLFILLSKYTKWILPLIRKIGLASLEIYLIQGMFFTLVINGVTSIYPEWHDTLSILMIIASSILGIATHWIIDKSGILKFL